MASAKHSFALVALLLAVHAGIPAFGSRQFNDEDEMRDDIPSVATWNCGGGAPKPEYLGGGWEATSGGFWSEAEKRIGALILKITGLPDEKADFDYSRYNPLKSTVSLPAGVTTVAQLLEGLPEAANRTGYDLARFACYEDLNVADVFKFVLGVIKKLPPKTLPGGKQCWRAQGFKARSFFSGPDGCLKERAKFGQDGFISLLGQPAEKYWETWLDSLPPTFSVGHCDVSGDTFVESFPPRIRLQNQPNIFGSDFLPLAIFDRLVTLVTKQYQTESGSATPAAPTITAKSAVHTAIKGIADWAAQQVDVLLLQENTMAREPVSGYTKFAAVEGEKQDTAIWIKSALANEAASEKAATYLATLRSSFGKNQSDLSEDFKGETARVATSAKALWSFRGKSGKYTEEVLYFWNDGVEKVSVAVAGTTVLVTAHADSSGYTCGEVLVLARMLQTMMGSMYGVLVGYDANVQPKAQGGTLDVTTLLRWADALNFKYPATRSTPYTVNKQRGFVQAQLLKAGKVDRVFKDWIFYSPPEAAAASYVQQSYQIVNNPASPATFLSTSFPTDSFPVDHFLVFMKGEKASATDVLEPYRGACG